MLWTLVGVEYQLNKTRRSVWKCGGDGGSSHAHRRIPVQFTKRRNVSFYTYIPYNLNDAHVQQPVSPLRNVCYPMYSVCRISRKKIIIFTKTPLRLAQNRLHTLWLFYENNRWMSTTFRWLLYRVIINNKQIHFQITIQSPFEITINWTMSAKLFNDTVLYYSEFNHFKKEYTKFITFVQMYYGKQLI